MFVQPHEGIPAGQFGRPYEMLVGGIQGKRYLGTGLISYKLSTGFIGPHVKWHCYDLDSLTYVGDVMLHVAPSYLCVLFLVSCICSVLVYVLTCHVCKKREFKKKLIIA